MPRKQPQVTSVTLPSRSGCNLYFTFKDNKLIDVQNMNEISLDGNDEARLDVYNQCIQYQQQEAQKQLANTNRAARCAARHNQDQFSPSIYQTPLQHSVTIGTFGTFDYNPDFVPETVDYSNVFNSDFETSRQGSLNSEFDLLSHQGSLNSELLSRQGSWPLDVEGLERYTDSMNVIN